MKQMMKIILVSVIFLISECGCSNESNFDIIREFPKGSGNKTRIYIEEFIKQGLNENIQTAVKENAVMVMGLPGTEKNTLINYLTGVPLICIKNPKTNKCIVELKFKNSTAPSTSHGSNFETLISSSVNYENEDFSYIDNPGFSDTHESSINIANGFYRKEITENVTNLKFLLLLTHDQLTERSDRITQSFQNFYDFLGIFDDQDTKNLSESIAIIVTKVENEGESDSAMRRIYQDLLNKYFKNAEKYKTYKNKKNVLAVFKKVVSNDQLEIFSNPKKQGDLNLDQSFQMIKLIKRLKYTKRVDAKIRVQIEQHLVSEFIQYTEKSYLSFENSLNAFLNKSILENKHFNNIDNATSRYIELKSLSNLGQENVEFALLLKNISFPNKEEIIIKQKIVSYYVDLLPEHNKGFFSFKKQWINVDLMTKINSMMDEIVDYLDREFEKFKKEFEIVIEKLITKYYVYAIQNASKIEDVLEVEKIFEKLQNDIITGMSFESIANEINSTFSIQIEENIFKKKDSLSMLILELPNTKKKKYFENKIWISFKFHFKLIDFLFEISDYKKDGKVEIDEKTSSLIYKGHFGKMSDFKIKIHHIAQKFKAIKIFATHSFIVDEDFKVDTNLYSSHSPDLFIIAPVIKFVDNVKIDLSCELIPGYPDEITKAPNNDFFGKDIDGDNGKPGLPGYNGGNLFAFSDIAINYENFNFISNGGQGGPGQNGNNFLIYIRPSSIRTKCNFNYFS